MILEENKDRKREKEKESEDKRKGKEECLEPLIRIFLSLSLLSVFLKLSWTIVQHRSGKEKAGLRLEEEERAELRSIAPRRHTNGPTY